MKNMPPIKIAFFILMRMVQYNIIEVAMIIGLLIAYSVGGVHPVALWIGFGLTALWVVSVSSTYAHTFAKQQVLAREMYILDFLSATVFICGLVWIVRHEDWYFPAMFALAAAQNFRYTCLSSSWLLAERRANEHRDDQM